jgi:membrane protein implicated in regulation of membrane protease activity
MIQILLAAALMAHIAFVVWSGNGALLAAVILGTAAYLALLLFLSVKGRRLADREAAKTLNPR